MKILDFDFHLPGGAAARAPKPERDAGRLLVVRREAGTIEHRTIREDLSDLIGDSVVYGNDTKIVKSLVTMLIPPKNVSVDGSLLREISPGRWDARIRLPNYFGPGSTAKLSDGTAFVIVSREADRAVLDFQGPVDLEQVATYQLPAGFDRPQEPVDWSRFEPIWAVRPGSLARASAGACVTPEILGRLKDFRTLTLHIDLDSYDAITDEELGGGQSHRESYSLEMPPDSPVVAIGSTVVRALEAFALDGAMSGETSLFIAPGHEFRLVKGLLTNLHFPLESVLVMTCAFGGYDLVMKAYREAAAAGYVFGDWGDSMLIL